MPDPQLDDLLTQSKQELEKTNQLQGSLAYGIAQDPTQQRQVQSTARSLGVSPDLVQQNPKAMNEAARLNGFDFDAFARTYPITTQIMSNPLTAAASHDDLETYKTIEQLMSANNAVLLPGSYGVPVLLGKGTMQSYAASVLNAPMQVGVELAHSFSGLGKWAGDFTKAHPALSYLTALNPAMAFIKPLGDVVNSTPEVGSTLTGASDAAESMLQTLAPISTGAKVTNFVAKMPFEIAKYVASGPLAPALMGAESFGSSYSSARKAGSSVDRATLAAGVSGTLGMGLGLVPDFGKPAESFAGLLGQKTLRGIGLGTGMFLGNAGATAIYSPDQAEKMLKDPSAWGESVATMLAFEYAGVVQHAGEASRGFKLMNDLQAAVKASKMAAEDPQAFQDHLSQLAKGTEVGMPADSFVRYWQAQGEDPTAKAQEMGIDNLNEAAATGTDVQIPIDRFLTATVGTPHFEELAKDIRLTPGAPTLREADLQAQNFADNVKASQAELQKMATTETEHPDREAIFERTRAQLLAAGGEAAKTADETAKLLTNFSINMAGRASTPEKLISPQDIADRLNIFRAEPGQENPDGTPAVSAPGRRAQGPLLSNAGGSEEARGLTAPEHDDIHAARVADLQGRDGAEVLAFTRLSDLKNAERTDLTTPRLGLPATGYVDGDQLGVSVYKYGVHAWVTAQVRDGHLYTGTLDQSSDTGIPGIGTDLLQSLGQLAVEKFPELKGGNLYGVAGGKMRGGQLYSEGIERTRNRFTNTIWDGVKASTPISDLLDTRFDRPTEIKGESGDPMGQMFYQPSLGGTDSPAFKAWFGQSQVTDAKGRPLIVYHGTTGEFDTFSRAKANPESDWGSGFYFSNKPEDVAANYAGEGPDLTSKIERRAEQIASETGREYDDPAVIAEAKAEFKAHEGATLPVFLKMDTPFEIGGKKETFLDYDEPMDAEGEFTGEPPTGKLASFIEALRDVASRYYDGEVDQLIGTIMEEGFDGGMKASRLMDLVNKDEQFAYYTDENGNLSSKEIVREALQEAGFDGIIDRTVNQKFGSEKKVGKQMVGMTPDTVHYIVFEPNQVKSATGNRGTFDPNNPSMLYQSPVFYSALERAVPDMAKIADKNGEVQPEQAKAWLAARQKEGKFKQAELDTIGVNDWLDLQKGKVPVSELQAFIKQNGVQVQEVFKGGAPDVYHHRMLDNGKFEVFNQRTGKVYGTYSDVFDAGAAIDRASGASVDTTKFGDYTLPGGTDYRELLLTLPVEKGSSTRFEVRGQGPGAELFDTELGHVVRQGYYGDMLDEAARRNAEQVGGIPPFRSSHWDEPNILAHIRFNSRTDADGKPVLFIEEIQSDWGQKGKKEGFASPQPAADTAQAKKVLAEVDAQLTAAYAEKDAAQTRIDDLYKQDKQSSAAHQAFMDAHDKVAELTKARTEANNKLWALEHVTSTPTAPFVTDTKAWVALSLKRMIRYAADNGFDRVAFVNGEQSADRYDLSKSIDDLYYNPDTWRLVAKKDGNRVIDEQSVSPDKLEDYIGKEAAQKIMAQEPSANGLRSLEGENLKVGGEGMKAFYDKIVPSVANDVLKKLGGGKVGEVDIQTGERPRKNLTGGIFTISSNGKEYWVSNSGGPFDGDQVGPRFASYSEAAKHEARLLTGSTPQLGFDITPELKAKVQEGMPLFQPTAGAGGPRGFLEFGKDNKFNLGLLNDDKSTPIHELGHFYLEVLHELSTTPGTSEQVRSDYTTIRKWLGAEGDAPLTVDQHEQFARAHELYMREGKAPTEGLRGAFQRFGRWLTKIYQTAEQLQVPMTDEVRGVFDRLYASDSEIESARKAVGDLPMFATAKDMGVTEKEFQAYKKLKDSEITSAKEKLLAELTRQHADEQKAEWREGLAQKRDEVAAELDADPAYQALKVLVAGHMEDGTPVKLSREALVERYGEAKLKELGRGQGFVYAKEGGMDADAAALLLGHESGDALINSLTGLEPRGKRIAREAEARMKAEKGDLMSDESALKAKALEELHSTKREEVLALELKALNRLKRGVAPVVESAKTQLTAEQRQAQADRDALAQAQGSVARAEALKSASEKRSIEDSMPPMRAYRIAASAFVDNTPLVKTDPNKYLLAQRKAGKAAFDLQGKGDYAGAAEAKQQEILNHFMYLEAVRAKQNGEKAYQFAQKLQKPQVVAKLAKAGGTYLDQVNALLDRFEFGRVSNAELARRETLAQWVEAQTNMNEEPAIADKLLDESFKVNYRQLNNADLRDLHDALKNIRHLAYRQLEVLVGDRRVAFADLIDQLDSAARANNKVTPLSLPGSTETASQKAHDFLAGKDAAMVKIEQMVNWLDGNDVNGPWHEAIWNPIARAETADYDLITKVTGKLMDALDQMPKEQQNSMADVFQVDGINQPLNRRQLITMLFNMGTDMNKMKLTEGFANYGFTPETVDRAIGNLNRYDTAFVQKAWDSFGYLWPKIVDHQKGFTGVEPKREEITPYTVRFKDGTTETLEGGYFPLKAAAGRSTVAGKQESSGTALFDYGGGYVKATTMTGHTKERTAAVYPLDLDFTHIIAQHTTQVVKDLTHREAVILANRLLTHPTVRKAMQETMGDAYTDQFMPWLRSIVNDRNGAAAASASAWTSVATATRGNLVAALLGFKFSTVIVQMTDPLRVIGPGDYRVPVPTYSKALLDYLQHPNDVTKMVRELSGEMRHRPENLDRDIRAQWEHLQGDASWRAAWNRKAFHGLGMVDALTSVPSWLGAYRHALSQGETPENAVLKADRTVRLTLMSGSPKDLLGVQRDPNTLAKLITMFMGDGPAQYGLLRNAGRKGLGGIPEFTAVAVMMSLANIMGDALKGQNPAPNEDKALFYLRKALLAWSQPIPIVRDLATSIDSGLAGKPFSDYRLSPVVSVGQKFVQMPVHTMKLIEGKEDYPDYAIKAFDLLGTLYGVGGTSQAVASAKYLRRVYTGEEKPANAAELVSGAVQGKPKQGVK